MLLPSYLVLKEAFGLRVPRRIYYLVLAVAVLTLLWILTLPAILPEDIREAYMNYFRIIRAITVIIVGVLALEVVASIITRRLGILAGKSTSSETLSL
jgi:hypothetical protein